MASPSGEASSHFNNSTHVTDTQTREASASLGTNAAINKPCEESTSDESTLPLMIDIMSGPNAPLAKGFMMAQWRTASIDRIFGEHHDLSDSKV